MRNYILLTIILAALLSACTQEKKQEGFTEEKAFDFLYQYMPLGDSVDYPEDYYRESVAYAFRAKSELPWGSSIPEREFKHFVVPVRVNNENLDRFRATYYEVLKGRVKDLSLYDAVLEVNHWCHEHVNYKGSDSRTSAPMATIKTSWGRCGEESTLLVTALRTVCIPARQVYTPRWAHCDDNHAWVEAYVDGGWHFLGACEPEPVLDLGWFNEPASRALLLHTRVFGDYDGPEEVISRNDNYTEINVVDNYGKTAKTVFTVVDTDNRPQAGIPVEFKIYNYAEYCTVVTKTTDENGQTWLTAGLGTMMAYAANNGKFGFQLFQSGAQDQVTLVLDHGESKVEQFEYDIIPPAPAALIPEVSPEMRAQNDQRIAYEDSLRNSYIADCKNAQRNLIMNTGNKTLCRLYEKTWGNYQTIADFMNDAREKGEEVRAVRLLETLSDKDLRDITPAVLNDHFYSGRIDSGPLTTTQNDPYVYSPRISNEMIVAWRKTLSECFQETERLQFHDQPELLVDWVRQNITVNDALNPQRIPISPIGVLKTRKADTHSRDIFFVALARSQGIPAQINPVNGNVEYQVQDSWKKAVFEAATPVCSSQGYLDLRYQPTEAIPDPKYYTHFSIKKYDGQHFKLLAYDAQDPGIDDGMTLSSFPHPIPLEPGYYILTGGTRLSDGSVLAHSQFFNIKEGQTTSLELILRQQKTTLTILGTLDDVSFTETTSGETRNLVESGSGCRILGFLDQGSEPTTHAMQDIAAFKENFEQNGVPIWLLFDDKNTFQKFLLKKFNTLPETVSYGIDDHHLKEKVINNLKIQKADTPVFIVINSTNEVVFASQGYTIGLGDQLLKTLAALDNQKH